MNKSQTTILWLGLTLVALTVIVNIGDFKSLLFGGPGKIDLTSTTNIPGASTSPQITLDSTSNQQQTPSNVQAS